MITDIHSFLSYYSKVKARTARLIAVVQPQHMSYSYAQDKFTVADIIRHMAAVERYMFAETALGRANRYSGCGPELADGYDAVLAHFHAMHQETHSILSELSDNDLNRKCITPAGTPVSLWRWLMAMTEHEIHHRGQLYLYLNMLQVITPPMFGLTSEELAAAR